jgi:hypothetical protein
MPVLPRDAAVNRIVRLHGPNLAVPDVHFNHAHAEAVVVTGRITDNLSGLSLIVHVCNIHSFPSGFSQIIAHHITFNIKFQAPFSIKRKLIGTE